MVRLLLAAALALWSAGASARETVDASPPLKLAVTLYRAPNRPTGAAMQLDDAQGFAMISETRRVTLPPGESTVRFTGVAEGMVAVSAIVTGLPGGTIEKNRNADVLSPAALVDGTLGNRVTITRTNPKTGKAISEDAIVRTRADGGLVLQTGEGFEAVRCSGLPEKLTFDRVPAGLSAQPVFSIDTRDAKGGTYTVQLTYLAWGFDWEAHYVATLAEPAHDAAVRLRLMSWLTLLNDNGQSFPDAELLVVAGKLNVTSNYQQLAEPPQARPLQLTCYPLGHSWTGSRHDYANAPPPPPPPPAPMMMEQEITVTGARMAKAYDAAAMVAREEQLGDLKAYRVPEPVTVAAKGLKQVAFLDRGQVEGRVLYKAVCVPGGEGDEPREVPMLLATVNDARHGLGITLPQGGLTVFEPAVDGARAGDLLVGEPSLRDYAQGQDIELELGTSHQVFAQCSGGNPDGSPWGSRRTVLTNANRSPMTVRLVLGAPDEWKVRGLKGTRIKDGQVIAEVVVPGNGRREIVWQTHAASAASAAKDFGVYPLRIRD